MPFRRSEAGPREWIDRSRAIAFHFEGQEYSAHPGDTLSSALLANGVTLLGRSFKYHRPRGAFSLADHDVNALFCTKGDTHLRGDVTPLRDGMDLYPVNVRGTLANDADRYLDRLARFLPVGFYYKAFYRPRALFPRWERAIRNRAGLGSVDRGWKAQRRPKRNEHCDVLVVGAGPAGLSAALAAAEAGFSVVIADDNAHPGGSFDYQWLHDEAAQRARDELIAAITAHPEIRLLCPAVALGHYADHLVPLSTPGGIVKMRARGVIVATGLIEQPAVFRNNDRPGVMLASGAQRLLHRFGVAPCRRAVVLTANSEGYAAALDMHRAGVEVAAVLDMREGEEASSAAAMLVQAGVPLLYGHAIYEAHGAEAVEAVTAAPLGSPGRCNTVGAQRIACDGVLLSTGWAPAGALLYQAGGSFRYDAHLAMPVPERWPDTVVPAGRLNGAFTLAQQQADARDAAQRLVAALRGDRVPAPADHRDDQAHGSEWPVIRHPEGRNFVDFDEDLQLKDLEQAAREGFDNIELLKRYSTVGMGPSQGKHSNLNAIRILADHLGQGIDETGSTTARPMVRPVRLEDLAGRRLRPQRLTPLHDAHQALGAHFMEAGEWLRPAFYGDAADADSAIAAEVAAVRGWAGLIDVSTLGKIEVLGADAGRLLEAAYTMRMTNMAVGRTRYALMVDSSGVIVDDGIVGRLAEDRYYVTTTSGHAAATFRTLSRCALEWGLDVHLLNRTGQLGALNLAGPEARRLLAPLVSDVDLDEEAFPYLGIREGRVCGHPARLARVGFVGELGYELHLDARATAEVWQALMRNADAPRPFGVEAQRLLRLEKGHIIVGQDTDGLSDPFEAGMGWAVHFKKPFFNGRAALQQLKPRKRRRLVGFALPAGLEALPRECHLVIRDGVIAGRVTSIAHSPTLRHPVGLAMVDAALADSGEALHIRGDDGRMHRAEQRVTPFYDPEGLRQKAEEAAA